MWDLAVFSVCATSPLIPMNRFCMWICRICWRGLLVSVSSLTRLRWQHLLKYSNRFLQSISPNPNNRMHALPLALRDSVQLEVFFFCLNPSVGLLYKLNEFPLSERTCCIFPSCWTEGNERAGWKEAEHPQLGNEHSGIQRNGSLWESLCVMSVLWHLCVTSVWFCSCPCGFYLLHMYRKWVTKKGAN